VPLGWGQGYDGDFRAWVQFDAGAIGYAAFTETPCVIIDVQRAGPCTGQATRVGSGDIMQAKWGSHGDYQVIALSPWSVQEMYDLTIGAFNLSEQYRVPAFVMADEAWASEESMSINRRVEIWIERRRKRGPLWHRRGRRRASDASLWRRRTPFSHRVHP